MQVGSHFVLKKYAHIFLNSSFQTNKKGEEDMYWIIGSAQHLACTF